MQNSISIRPERDTTRSSFAKALSNLKRIVQNTITDSKCLSFDSALLFPSTTVTDTYLDASILDNLMATATVQKMMVKHLVTGADLTDVRK